MELYELLEICDENCIEIVIKDVFDSHIIRCGNSLALQSHENKDLLRMVVASILPGWDIESEYSFLVIYVYPEPSEETCSTCSKNCFYANAGNEDVRCNHWEGKEK